MSEFSRIVSLQELGERESVHDISASEAECAAVAARFGLEAVDDLRATVRLRRTGDGLIRLLAEYHAAVIQICVVTLDPVRDVIESCVDVQFGPEGERDAREVVIDLAEDMEPLTGDSIDIGEIVAQELALSLNPYPRKPGVEELLGPGGGTDAVSSPEHPFSVLAALKRGNQS